MGGMNITVSTIQQQWSVIAPLLTIRNEQDYDDSVARLNSLIDEVGTNEEHPLYTLLDTLGILIESYETEHFAMPDCSGNDVLHYLMEEHSLSPADLPELGSAQVVEEVLKGTREISVRQIKVLASRFSLSPAAFI